MRVKSYAGCLCLQKFLLKHKEIEQAGLDRAALQAEVVDICVRDGA